MHYKTPDLGKSLADVLTHADSFTAALGASAKVTQPGKASDNLVAQVADGIDGDGDELQIERRNPFSAEGEKTGFYLRR